MFCSSKTKAMKSTSVLYVQNLFVRLFCQLTLLVIFCRSSHRRRLAYTILLLILFFAHTNESFAFTPT